MFALSGFHSFDRVSLYSKAWHTRMPSCGRYCMVAKIPGYARLCSAESAVPFGYFIIKEE
jgi:hypothetical protein